MILLLLEVLMLALVLLLALFGGKRILDTVEFDLRLFAKDEGAQFEGDRGELQPQIWLAELIEFVLANFWLFKDRDIEGLLIWNLDSWSSCAMISA